MSTNTNHVALDIERALLGLIIYDKTILENVKGILVIEDFYALENQLVYQSILNISNLGYDIELAPLIQNLKDNRSFEKIGGKKYLDQLIDEAGIQSNLNQYLKTLGDLAQLRKLKYVLGNLESELQKSHTTAEKILEKVENDVLSTTRESKTKEFEIIESVLKRSMEDLILKSTQKGVSGLATDLPSLDQATSGLQKGDLIILAARPAMGKTAFALNLAANVARSHRVALFSLEMPSTQLVNRILSFSSFVPGQRIREASSLSRDDWNKLELAKDNLSKYHLYTDDSSNLKLSELVWKSRRLHKNVGLDLIVIDYLQLLTTGDNSSQENRQNEVSVISRTLKQLARELSIPVIALSQLSRKVEMRENKTPMMSDLRESGAIEQDADIIAFLYREAYYNDEKAAEESTHHSTQLIIAKHRNGANGTLNFVFRPDIGLFTDPGKGFK